MVDQETPYGSISYANSGWWPDSQGLWVPHFKATTTLSPELQALVSKNLANATDTSNIESSLLKNVSGTLGKPLDLSWGATEAKLDELGRNTIDPQYASAEKQLDQELYDRGLTPGSEMWETMKRQFGDTKTRAYNDLYLRGHQQAVDDIMKEYTTPLNTLTALRSNAQVAQPGVGALAPTPQAQVQSPDYMGMVENNYKTAVEQNNAKMGGLFGLGGQALGLAGKFIGLSDERDKTDIEKLGKDTETGLEMYAYRYKGDPKSYPKVVGPMAQDIEKKAPEMVKDIGRHKVVFGLGGPR